MKKAIAFRQPAPRPPSDDLDTWVSGPNPTAKSEPRKPPVKLARLTIDLPTDLHARFKAACAIHHTRMIDEVKGFIDDWTQKHS